MPREVHEEGLIRIGGGVIDYHPHCLCCVEFARERAVLSERRHSVAPKVDQVAHDWIFSGYLGVMVLT